MALFKPPYGSFISNGNPLSRGLLAAYDFNCGSGINVYPVPYPELYLQTAYNSFSWTDSGIYSNEVTLQCNNPILQPQKVTVEVLFKPASSVDNYACIVLNRRAGSNPWNSYGFYRGTSTTSKFVISTGASEGDFSEIEVSGGWASNTWIHLVGTYDNSYLRVYKNGQFYDETARAGSINYTQTYGLLIGNDSTSSSSYAFKGEYDRVRIWDRVLTEEEINSLYFDPYQIYARPSGKLYFFAPSLQEYDLSAGTGVYSLSGSAAEFFKDYAIDASGGSYSVGGVDAGLLRGLEVDAASGSYSFTGTSATLKHGHLLSANNGSHSLVGSQVSLLRLPKLFAGGGSYSLDGVNAALLRGLVFGAETGSYSVTGEDVTLTYTPVGSYTLTADGHSYVLTGADAGLMFDRKILAGAGNYSAAGFDAGLLYGRAVSAGSGSYSVAGTAASFLRGLKLAASEGSYDLGGAAAGLLYDRIMSAGASSYLVAGTDANLVHTPIGSYVITANSGAYLISGVDANLLHPKSIAANSGSYATTGMAAGLFRGLKVSAGPGAYILSGSELALKHDRIITVDSGIYGLTGLDADLIKGIILSAEAGEYAISGIDVNFSRDYVLGAVAGAYNLTGTAATLTYSAYVLPTGCLLITITVNKPSIAFSVDQPSITFTVC